eukprot:1781897-Rhodomonas_salina.1
MTTSLRHVWQVEYYFSRENLCQDAFLVGKMDAQHFVEVAVIADFKMVKQLTTDQALILECVKDSTKVRFLGVSQPVVCSCNSRDYHSPCRVDRLSQECEWCVRRPFVTFAVPGTEFVLVG